jgi:phytoene synthase
MSGEVLESYLAEWREAEPRCAVARLFLRPDERLRFGALAALQQEWLKIVRGVSEPQVAAAKLGWWREELQRAVQGQPRHPLTQALFADARVREVPTSCWTAAVDAAMPAIVATTPADFSAQCEAIRPLATALADLETRVWFGATVDSNPRAAAATAFGLLVADLRAFMAKAGNGRSPLPMNLLARHGLTIDALAKDGPARRAALRDHVEVLERGLAGVATMHGRLTLFRTVRMQHDLDMLKLAAHADDPLKALWAPAHGLRSLLKTWRAARTWRKVSNHEATP